VSSLRVCLYTRQVQCWQTPEEDMDFLELEFQTVVSCHVDARSWAFVLWKRSQSPNHWVISPAYSFFFFFFFFLNWIFIYISNVFPFLGLLFGNPLSHPPSSCLCEGAPPFTHPTPYSHPGIPAYSLWVLYNTLNVNIQPGTLWVFMTILLI
jgi:hypothetical protein